MGESEGGAGVRVMGSRSSMTMDLSVSKYCLKMVLTKVSSQLTISFLSHIPWNIRICVLIVCTLFE